MIGERVLEIKDPAPHGDKQSWVVQVLEREGTLS